MNLYIKQLDNGFDISNLYDLLKETDYNIGIFYNISKSDFISILVNGITLIAFDDGKPIGFTNFEVLKKENQRYCIHNFLFSALKNKKNEIWDILFNEELNYLLKLGDVDFIKVRVLRNSKDDIKFLNEQGFFETLETTFIYKRSYIKVFEFTKNILLDEDVFINKNNNLKLNTLRKIKRVLKYNRTGDFTKTYLFYLNFRKRCFIYKARKCQKNVLHKISTYNCVNVVFIASSLSMWKYQHLYDLMHNDKRFKLNIVISPFINFSLDSQKEEVAKLCNFFDKLNISYIPYDFNGEGYEIKSLLNPDLLFYPQPSYDLPLLPNHCPEQFKDKLLSYYPYGYYVEDEALYYNDLFQEIAWKLFYSNEQQRQHSEKYAMNHGANVSVVGYPLYDDFVLRKPKDVWKHQEKLKKKIIWAPHFSINSNTSLTNHSNFMLISDFMIDIAIRYSDYIQIAFKPHPRLKSELYNNFKWGKQKTDAYFSKWEQLHNTQLEDGDFIDLFLTSDAMIHDSASFCVDYLYTNKPVMYLSSNIDEYKSALDDFGKKVMDLHYIGKNKDNIVQFIEDVILEGKDPLRDERYLFVTKYLTPRIGTTVAEITFNTIKNELFK